MLYLCGNGYTQTCTHTPTNFFNPTCPEEGVAKVTMCVHGKFQVSRSKGFPKSTILGLTEGVSLFWCFDNNVDTHINIHAYIHTAPHIYEPLEFPLCR